MTDATGAAIVLLVFFVILLVLLYRSIHTIQADQTGVVLLLGSYRGLLRPGFNLVSPLAQVRRVQMNLQTLSLGTWRLPLTGGATSLTGTVSYRVTDPARATFQVARLDDELTARCRAAVAATLDRATAPLSGGLVITLDPAARAELDTALGKCGIAIDSVLVQRAPG